MVEVDGLSKQFRGKRDHPVQAVNRVTFRCLPGEVFGLLGVNGAGKTTTLRVLATLLTPSGGTATVQRHDIIREAGLVRRNIGFLSAATALYGRLTGDEVVTYFGRLHGLPPRVLASRKAELFSALGIDEFKDRRCDQCSTGMKQRISIARSLIHDPPVMIFDEPTLGLDVLGARQIVRFIQDCRAQGKTVLFSTHVMSEVEKLCDRVAIIHQGQIRSEGSVDELAARFGSHDMEEIFVRAVGEEDGIPSVRDAKAKGLHHGG